MKRIIALLLPMLIAAACAIGCAGRPGKTEPSAQPTEAAETTPEPAVSMFDLSEALRSAHNGSAELSYVSSSDQDPAGKLAYVSDIDYEKVESFMMLYAADGKESTDEIVVIALKEASDAPEAADTLRTHVESRISLYSTYAPELVEPLRNAKVFCEGRYAVLIISENADAVSRAFSAFVK